MLPMVLLAWLALSIVVGLFTGLFMKAGHVRVTPLPLSARSTLAAARARQAGFRDRATEREAAA